MSSFARIGRNTAGQSLLPKDPGFYTHLPYLIELDDEVVRTRQNGLMISLEIAGLDGMTAAPQDIHELRRALAGMIDGLDERFSFYIHRLHRRADLGLTPIHGESFARDLDQAWRKHLAAQDLHDFVIVLTVVSSLPAPLRVPLFGKAAAKLLESDTEARLHDLRELVAVLESGLPHVTTRRLRISDGSLIGFYTAISTGLLAPAWRGEMSLIAEDAVPSAATFYPDAILFDEGIGPPRHAAVLAVKRYSQETWPGMLDALDASLDTVICHSFTPIAAEKIAGRVRLRVEQMRAADDLATTIQQQLIETADEVESGGKSVGLHQLTITVFADSREELDHRISKIKGIAERARVKLTRCTHSLEASFFASHPGNMDYQCWGMAVATTTFADLASLHMSDAGSPAEALHWRTPITVFQGASGAPHRFSFQGPGRPDSEPPLGHTLVLGPSDSGKTTTVAFLAAQALRVRPRIIIFDKDEGLKSLVAALGGSYARIRAGQGEEIRSVAAGDLESFHIDKLEGANVFTIKPVIEGASTNVTVETNRRFYFLQVSESRATPNWSVRFNTPDDGRSSRRAPSVRPLPTAPPKKMRYAVSRGSSGADFAPVGVSDDGQKTHFQIPPGAPMPSLFRVDAKGREYAINSHAKGEIITVAARSERWVLRYGDDYICVTGREE